VQRGGDVGNSGKIERVTPEPTTMERYGAGEYDVVLFEKAEAARPPPSM
jgi:hypothetical protein